MKITADVMRCPRCVGLRERNTKNKFEGGGVLRMAEQEFHGIRAASAVDALSIAAANSLLREMKLLLADGVDVNGIASYCGATALHTAARLGLIRSTELLIRIGADLNVTDRMELTPLMSACSLGKVKGSSVALRLIQAGADVRYIRTADEMTALKFSVHSCPAEVIQVLIDHGAEVDGPPGTDQTALMIAARCNNVAALKVLVENGADTSLSCKLPWAEGRTAEGLAELEGRRAALTYLRRVQAG
jgi:ankyrin repeat protein